MWISVEFTHIFYYDIDSDSLPGATGATVGVQPATGRYSATQGGPTALKTDIQQALVAEFGRAAVTRGNKSVQVRESSRLLAADVVPCFSYRLYYRRAYNHDRAHLTRGPIPRRPRLPYRTKWTPHDPHMSAHLRVCPV